MTELSAVVRFVHLAAAILLVGSFAFVLWIALPALRKAGAAANSHAASCLRFHRQIVCWSIFAVSLSALFGLWMQILNVSDPAAQTFFDRLAVMSLLTDTQYGKVWLGRMVLGMLLAALLFHLETKRIKLRHRSILPLASY